MDDEWFLFIGQNGSRFYRYGPVDLAVRYSKQIDEQFPWAAPFVFEAASTAAAELEQGSLYDLDHRRLRLRFPKG